MKKRIGMLVFPGFQVMDLAAVSAFELANGEAGQPCYEVALLSESGGPVRSSSGVVVETRLLGQPRYDTLIMGGSLDIQPTSAAVRRFLRAALRGSRRIASICTGAFGLADAGLLDGRRATTHWVYAQMLGQRYPRVRVEPDRIFIHDDGVWTSAGMTAGIDLALALIEEDLGREAAQTVARKLVVYYRRPGGQSQFSALLEMEPRSDRIERALAHARAHLRDPLSVEDLAGVANLSPRQFSRVFKAETGRSPAHAVESLRVEAARVLIDESRLALSEVAREAGFGDPERMRRAFLRTLGLPPQAVRRQAGGAAMS